MDPTLGTADVDALDIRGLSKTFGAQRALKELSLTVRPGEVHALVGENGSGKSTLVKCLSGYHQHDEGGEVRVGGELLPSSYGPQQAAALGLSFVHQDLGLIPSLSVAANVFLGQQPETCLGWRIRSRREVQIARELLARLGRPDIDPRSLVAELSLSSRAVVAMARCLRGATGAGVVVLDEPTAPLAVAEVGRLLAAVRAMAAEGHGVVYISHRFDEIFSVADRVTVLRDGAKVATVAVDETTPEGLAELMIGRELVAGNLHGEHAEDRPVRLQVEGLSGSTVQSASFGVHDGEIVGVAGLQGCGKSELGRLLFGAQRSSGGTVVLDGTTRPLRTPAHAVRAGVAMVPANRHRDGVHLSATVADNITMVGLSRFFRRGHLHDRERLRLATQLVGDYDVQPRNAGRLMSQLSGGNQQKAVLAKWLHREPRLIILDEPAQAMDVGAKANVYSLLERAAAAGTSVLVISEEFDDLARLCDRVLVMREGRIVATLSHDSCTSEHIADLVYRRTDAA